MKRLIKITAFLLVVIMLAVPVLGQMGGGMMGGGTDGGMGSGMMGSDMMRGKAKDMMIRGNEMRGTQGMMGMGFMHSQGSSYGNYVTFSVDNNTGAVMDYGIVGVTIFDSIKVAGFDFKESTTMGALTRIINRDGSAVIQLHDNPAAVINIGTKASATITFDLADGVNASKEDNIVRIEAGNLTAFIASTNATSINIAGGEIRIGSVRGNAVFRAIPVNMPADGMHRRFMGEMMRNRAGAEVSVGVSDKYSITNYSEGMNVMIRSMDRNRMRMTVNSTDPSGKFMMMNLDNSSMMWNPGQRVRLYLDNKPMRQVMTAEELYDAKESSFWLTMPGGNRMQAMMYIANFSERVVDVVVEEESTPAPTSTEAPVKTPVLTSTPAAPGFEIALGLLGAGVVYRLRRKS
ncbi:hypothetical protein [Candidatus Methanoperedens nitratireducens]|nr:hypothetical protein [Candidatus Methanoperedens nitroreducens]